MLKLLKPLPKNVVVALSGGVDSMAACDFLRRKHTVTAAFYHHGTPASNAAHLVVAQYCATHKIPLMVGMLLGSKPAEQSQEEWWRNCRYDFFDGLGSTLGPIVTAHHLDDCTETYLWSTLHGTAKVIPYERNNVVRPFLTTPKSEFVEWCSRHGVEWSEDASNSDVDYTRNYIRHNLMSHALKVNPGLHTVVKKIILRKLDTDILLQPIDTHTRYTVHSVNW
jgi:tRNA(Ile)-lysidine synthase